MRTHPSPPNSCQWFTWKNKNTSNSFCIHRPLQSDTAVDFSKKGYLNFLEIAYIWQDYKYICIFCTYFILYSDCGIAVHQRSAVILWPQLWSQTPPIWESWTWVTTTYRIQEWSCCVIFCRVQTVDWRLWGQIPFVTSMFNMFPVSLNKWRGITLQLARLIFDTGLSKAFSAFVIIFHELCLHLLANVYMLYAYALQNTAFSSILYAIHLNVP